MNKLKIEESKKEKKNSQIKENKIEKGNIQIKESKEEENESKVKRGIVLLIKEPDKSEIKEGKKLLLDSNLSTIETIIKTWPALKDIKKLLRLKHALKGSKVDNLALAILSAVISGVLPVFITNGFLPVLNELLLSEITNNWYSLLIGLIFIVFYVTVAYFCIRGLLHFRFLDNAKIDVIVDLIDIEIEKRKKAPENNTSAEND